MKKIKSILANLKNVTFGTWVRTLAAVGTAAILVLPLIGINIGDWDETKVQMTAAVLLKAGASLSVLWVFWKNNSFTPEAQEADKVLHGELDACPLSEGS